MSNNDDDEKSNIKHIHTIEDEIYSNLEEIPSDTEFVCNSIEDMSKHYYGFIFMHQIYATLTNHSIVDQEIHHLRHNLKKYKLLNCKFPKTNMNLTVLINTKNYISSIYKFIKPDVNHSLEETKQLCHKFTHWLENSSHISMFRKDFKIINNLEEDMILTDKEIDWLLQIGFIQYRSSIDIHTLNNQISTISYHVLDNIEDLNNHIMNTNEIYWLAHPLLRTLLQFMENSQQEIINIIKQSKYKEISEKKLYTYVHQNINNTVKSNTSCTAVVKGSCNNTINNDTIVTNKRKRKEKNFILRNSPFPLSYHILDMIGREVIFKVNAPATTDHIIRLKSN